MNNDYYKVLGLERDASDEDIKKAYRTKAKKFHPDVNPGDSVAEGKFKEINEAHDVLKDSQKKSNYDQFGDPDGRPGFNPRGTQPQGFRYASTEEFDDIIGNFFRARGMDGSTEFHFTPRQMKNPDLVSQLQITLKDAYTGTTTYVELTEPDGNVKNISITIPPGTKDNMTLRVKGKGYQNNTNLPAGDLLLRINIIPHNIFKPIGMDLFMKKDITIIEATLGGEFEVSLINDTTIKVTIPEGIQPNQKIRLKGKGMPGLNNINTHGDLYILINVKIPTNLTKEQKEVLQQFAVIS